MAGNISLAAPSNTLPTVFVVCVLPLLPVVCHLLLLGFEQYFQVVKAFFKPGGAVQSHRVLHENFSDRFEPEAHALCIDYEKIETLKIMTSYHFSASNIEQKLREHLAPQLRLPEQPERCADARLYRILANPAPRAAGYLLWHPLRISEAGGNRFKVKTENTRRLPGFQRDRSSKSTRGGRA